VKIDSKVRKNKKKKEDERSEVWMFTCNDTVSIFNRYNGKEVPAEKSKSLGVGKTVGGINKRRRTPRHSVDPQWKGTIRLGMFLHLEELGRLMEGSGEAWKGKGERRGIKKNAKKKSILIGRRKERGSF